MKNKQTKEISRESLKMKPNTSVDGECRGFLAELHCHDDQIHLKKRKRSLFEKKEIVQGLVVWNYVFPRKK